MNLYIILAIVIALALVVATWVHLIGRDTWNRGPRP